MKIFELNDTQFINLIYARNLYYEEAKKCRDAKSYLAGCVMIGAALETDLILMCHCYSNEISKKVPNLIPQARGKYKSLLKWSFVELLNVVRGCGWLPAGLNSEKDAWDEVKADIGDYAIILKNIRNLVHPSRYITDLGRLKMDNNYLETCLETLEVANDYFYGKLETSLKRTLSQIKKVRSPTKKT